jgi:hypothetical protein
MGVPTSEIGFGYTSGTTGRVDHKVHKGHVVAMPKKTSAFSGKYSTGDRIRTEDLTTVIRKLYRCAKLLSYQSVVAATKLEKTGIF